MPEPRPNTSIRQVLDLVAKEIYRQKEQYPKFTTMKRSAKLCCMMEMLAEIAKVALIPNQNDLDTIFEDDLDGALLSLAACAIRWVILEGRVTKPDTADLNVEIPS